MPISQAEIDGYGKLRAVWRTSPETYARQRLGMNPTKQQLRLLESISKPGAKVSVRAGHGTGKTGGTAVTVFWHLECFEFSRTIITAPSANQLHGVLWAEMSKWMRKADAKAKKDGLPKELWLSSLFTLTADRVYDNGAPKEWFIAARTSRKETPDALQGFHASDIDIQDDDTAVHNSESGGSLLFVIDEASGVPDEVFVVAEGALSSEGSRLLMLGNPVRNTGFFARSHKQDRGSYVALHFKCSESPLVSDTYRSALVRKYGEGSNIVRVRADGEFPAVDDNALISVESAEACLGRERLPDATQRRILGVDVARFGNDRTVFCVRHGPIIEHIKIASKQDTMVTVGQAVSIFQQFECDVIHVDVCGMGGGVVDRLTELKMPVIGVDAAGKAPERKRLPTDEQAFKMRDFLWLEMRDWLKEDEPSFAKIDKDIAEDLVGELVTPRYKFDSSGRITIESKDEMKQRMENRQSPDIADAVGITFFKSPVRGGWFS